MTDIPKLTAEQAACLRLASFIHDDARFEELCDQCDKNSLTFWAGSEADGPCLTDLGRAALAAYDAEQRRAIRAQAIAECVDVVNSSLHDRELWFPQVLGADALLRAIAAIERSVKP